MDMSEYPKRTLLNSAIKKYSGTIKFKENVINKVKT